MSNYSNSASLRNGAIHSITGGASRGVAANKNIKQVAAENTAKADNSSAVNAHIEDESKSDERKVLWYSFGITIGVALLIIAAIKFKLIKL